MSIKIKQMQSKGTGENIAPLTPEIAVYDTNGRRLNEKLLTLATKAELTAKADASALAEKADKTYVDTQLEGKASTSSVSEISSEITEIDGRVTALENGGGGGENWLRKIACVAPNGLTKGISYNEQTGFYEYGDLVDLTENDVLIAISNSSDSMFESLSRIPNPNITTGLLRNMYSNILNTCAYFFNSKIEDFCLYNNKSLECTNIYMFNVLYLFSGCKSLKRVKGISLSGLSTATNMFKNCNSLEVCHVRTIPCSISFAESPNLSAESIAWMINNANTSKTGIVLTLHATAYARAMADADVTAALAAHTNVSLAQA